MPVIHMTATELAERLPGIVAEMPVPPMITAFTLPLDEADGIQTFYVGWVELPPLDDPRAGDAQAVFPEVAPVTIRVRDLGTDVDIKVDSTAVKYAAWAGALEAALIAAAPATPVPRKRRGRPPGTGQYPGRNEFLTRLRIGLRVARKATGGRPPTKEHVAEGFEIGVRTLDNWLALAGTSWVEQLATLQEESN